MASSPVALVLLAATPALRQRLSSRLLDACSEWWHAPALVLAAGALATLVIWGYRRDAADLPWSRRLGLLLLRLGALSCLAVAGLDFQRTIEYEFVSPSRVAVLVDTSASMALTDAPEPEAAGDGGTAARGERALAVLDAGGLLAALRGRHEVSVWSFDATTERIAVLPRGDDHPTAAADPGGPSVPPAPADSTGDAAAPGAGSSAGPAADWRTRLVFQGDETRLGSALSTVLDQETPGLLSGVVVLTDGASNAGLDPRAAASLLATADVGLHPLGIGAETLPANVRVADVVAPARVFPLDRFPVTAFLQAQGLAGQRVRVELLELGSDDGSVAAAGTLLDGQDASLGADGDLVPVQFAVAGLAAPGRRTLRVRVAPPPGDRLPGDDVQEAEVEVVDRVMRVLLMASGPGREFQFMRNVLERDRSFSVASLLETARDDRGGAGAAFPESDAALAEYDCIVAFDVDWRKLDTPARERLERWVGRESGGIVFVAGAVATPRWLADPGLRTIRGLYPVEFGGLLPAATGPATPVDAARPLRLTRDGEAAEFLRLANDPAASETLWGELPGVYGHCETTAAKPGATVYVRLAAEGGAVRETQPIFLAGHYYGSGTALFLGSGELWRLRAVDPRLHERITTQIVRHVGQGRLLRGSRAGRLLVDRDRVPVGSAALVRVILPEGMAGRAATVTGRVRRPDGGSVPLPLDPEPGRQDVYRGEFVVSREGAWQVDVDLSAPAPERLSRRLQGHLPDRELARPRLDRELLSALAEAGGGKARFLDAEGWTPADSRALDEALPDRSRRVYEPGGTDSPFKSRLNALLLFVGVGLLCTEWLARRLLKLA